MFLGHPTFLGALSWVTICYDDQMPWCQAMMCMYNIRILEMGYPRIPDARKVPWNNFFCCLLCFLRDLVVCYEIQEIGLESPDGHLAWSNGALMFSCLFSNISKIGRERRLSNIGGRGEVGLSAWKFIWSFLWLQKYSIIRGAKQKNSMQICINCLFLAQTLGTFAPEFFFLLSRYKLDSTIF